MRKTILALLVAVSTAAWADDKQDQRNVYDEFREWVTPSADATVDEQGTAWIKRHMATLLYPVDMSSFVRPENDAKFRDVIVLLQRQMGTQSTGILTSGEYRRLAQAARDLDDRSIDIQTHPTIVSIAKDGSWVSALGTLAGDDIAHPINITRIMCLKGLGTCDLSSASFDLKTSFLWHSLPVTYVIKVWNSNTVVAVSEGACGVASMMIDVSAKTVSLADTGNCIIKTQSNFTLVDGGAVAWKIHQDKVNKARELVYEPARKLVPPVQNRSVSKDR